MNGLSQLLLFGAKRRVLTLLLLLCATLFFSFGLPRLEIDTGLDLLLNKNSDEYRNYQDAMDVFGSDETTIIFLKHPNLFSPDVLQVAQELVYELEVIESVERVDSLFTLTSVRDRDGMFENKAVIEFVPYDQPEADLMREDAVYSPLLLGNYVNKEANTMVVSVTLSKGKSVKVINKKFDELVEKYSSNFDELFHVGRVRTSREMNQRLVDDLRTLSPIALVILLLMVYGFLRKGVYALIPLATIVLSLTWTFGFLGFVNVPISILVGMLPALLIVIGSTEDIHLLSAYIEADGEPGVVARQDAIDFMARHMVVAVLITVGTTLIGFLSNSLSSIPVISDFAIAAAFGIFANAVVTFLSVPLLLSVIGPIPHKHGTLSSLGKENSKINKRKTVEWIQEVVYKKMIEPSLSRPKTVLILGVVVTIGALAVLPRMVVNNNPLSFFPEETQLLLDTDRVHTELTGIWSFFLTIDGQRPGAFLDPDNLNKLHKTVQAINQGGIFDRALTFTDHLSLVNQEMNGGDPDYFQPPKSKDLVEQYLLFFPRSDIEQYVTADYRTANVIVRHNILESEQLLGAVSELEAKAREIFGFGVSIESTGELLLINKASKHLVHNEVRAVLTIVAVVFVLMWLLYSSWRAGLLSLVPNLLPMLMTFATMVFLNIDLNPATAIVAALGIGVAVDDTTHLLTRFNRELRTADSAELAIRNTMKSEVLPILVSSLAVGAGFSVMLFSDFRMTAEFGLLGALAMLYAMFAEFWITPLLMKRMRLVNNIDILTLSLASELRTDCILFQGLTKYQLKKLFLLMKVVSFSPGETIIRQGESGREMYVIVEGRVDMQVEAEGIRTNLDSVGRGAIVGEAGYAGLAQRTATVTATEPTKTIMLEHEMASARLKHYPRLALILYRNIAQTLGSRLQSANLKAIN